MSYRVSTTARCHKTSQRKASKLRDSEARNWATARPLESCNWSQKIRCICGFKQEWLHPGQHVTQGNDDSHTGGLQPLQAVCILTCGDLVFRHQRSLCLEIRYVEIISTSVFFRPQKLKPNTLYEFSKFIVISTLHPLQVIIMRRWKAHLKFKSRVQPNSYEPPNFIHTWLPYKTLTYFFIQYFCNFPSYKKR